MLGRHILSWLLQLLLLDQLLVLELLLRESVCVHILVKREGQNFLHWVSGEVAYFDFRLVGSSVRVVLLRAILIQSLLRRLRTHRNATGAHR
jgi:hypothetical protein